MSCFLKGSLQHKTPHELETMFWDLVWVTIRNVKGGYSDGLLHYIFNVDNPGNSRNKKLSCLSSITPLEDWGCAPLEETLQKLKGRIAGDLTTLESFSKTKNYLLMGLQQLAKKLDVSLPGLESLEGRFAYDYQTKEEIEEEIKKTVDNMKLLVEELQDPARKAGKEEFLDSSKQLIELMREDAVSKLVGPITYEAFLECLQPLLVSANAASCLGQPYRNYSFYVVPVPSMSSNNPTYEEVVKPARKAKRKTDADSDSETEFPSDE